MQKNFASFAEARRFMDGLLAASNQGEIHPQRIASNDILRHTYASHHYACRRDIGWLQKNMGNSEDVLKRAYLDQTVVADQGEQLFRITLAAILA